jgi:hypothetical protein
MKGISDLQKISTFSSPDICKAHHRYGFFWSVENMTDYIQYIVRC